MYERLARAWSLFFAARNARRTGEVAAARHALRALARELGGKGITAVAIEDVNPKPRFQGDLFTGKPLSDNSYASLKTGDTQAMLISMGGGSGANNLFHACGGSVQPAT